MIHVTGPMCRVFLQESLLTAIFVSDRPRHVRLIGIVPQSTGTFGMSEIARTAVPHAAAAILRELATLGITVKRRSEPATSLPWWTAIETSASVSVM